MEILAMFAAGIIPERNPREETQRRDGRYVGPAGRSMLRRKDSVTSVETIGGLVIASAVFRH